MSQQDSIKDDRKYTKDHEWAKLDGDEILIGITAYAVDQLGDITLVSIDVAEGDSVKVGNAFGTVESVKTLADLFAPVGGTVTRVNGDLDDSPELVNDDCYGAAWMVAIKPNDTSVLDSLLDHKGYAELLENADH